jgi:hypothetical protein
MIPPSSRNLARAARANAAELVYLRTGRFSPPNQYAVWHLPTPGQNVLQVIAREGDESITLRILPTFEGGY